MGARRGPARAGPFDILGRIRPMLVPTARVPLSRTEFADVPLKLSVRWERTRDSQLKPLLKADDPLQCLVAGARVVDGGWASSTTEVDTALPGMRALSGEFHPWGDDGGLLERVPEASATVALGEGVGECWLSASGGEYP